MLGDARGGWLGSVEWRLGRELGSVTVSLEDLQPRLRNEQTPTTLLLIPCGMGGAFGLSSVTMAFRP